MITFNFQQWVCCVKINDQGVGLLDDLVYKMAVQQGLTPSEKELKVLNSQYRKLSESMEKIEKLDLDNVDPIIRFHTGEF